MKRNLSTDLMRYADMVEEGELISPDEMNCAAVMRLAAEALAKQEQGEPVAWFREEDEEKIYYATKAWDDCLPLYTTPQQRKPLTDEHAIFTGQCVFLDWNRKQPEPPVKIAYEYYVFQKAIEFYKEAAYGIK